MRELVHHVLRSAGAPLAFVEDRDVAEHARPRTAARGLHRREPLHRQDRGHVERHRFDEVEGQALAVGERPLVESAVQRPVGVVGYRAVSCPRHPRDGLRSFQAFDEVQQKLLAVAAADEVDLRALLLDEPRVQRGEHAAEREGHRGVGGADLPREDLGVRVARGAQETEADEPRALAPDLLDDDVVRRGRIGLIEHHALMPGSLEDRRQRHDADGREAHHPHVAVRGARGGRQRVELRIADVDQEDAHTASFRL